MAIAEITESLRKSFITLRSFHSCLISSKLSNSRAHFSTFPLVHNPTCPSTTDVVFSARGSPVEYLSVPLGTSYLQFQPPGVHPNVISRGLASKAHMKYAKRKKAPVDRFGTLEPSQPRLGFERVKELETADENVKKIFSLEFGSGTDLHKIRRKMTRDSVRDKPDEKDDLAVKIATITEHIRAVAPHVENNKKDSANKVRMLNAIDRRRKMLKYLRRRDHERFQRLLAELELTWTPPPEYYRRKTRRSLEKQAVVREAHAKQTQALRDFEERWRGERLVEIARLKEELGKELGEEERRALERSKDESAV